MFMQAPTFVQQAPTFVQQAPTYSMSAPTYVAGPLAQSFGQLGAPEQALRHQYNDTTESWDVQSVVVQVSTTPIAEVFFVVIRQVPSTAFKFLPVF